MSRSWCHRPGLLLAALLQLVLPGVASIADARLEAQATSVSRVHVESTSITGCMPVHSGDCALCRVLSGFTAAPRPATLPQAASVHRSSAPRLSIGAPVATAKGDPAQRAPPTA